MTHKSKVNKHFPVHHPYSIILCVLNFQNLFVIYSKTFRMSHSRVGMGVRLSHPVFLSFQMYVASLQTS